MTITLEGGNSLDDFDQSKVYFVMRPMLKNVPEGDAGDVLVDCEICGQKCWKRTSIEPDPLPPRFKPACTECALKAGVRFAREQNPRR